MDDGPWKVGLVPRGMGRDDGRDHVPLGRSDGRAAFAHHPRERSPLSPLFFTAGYLVTRRAAGLLALAIAVAGDRIAGDVLARDHPGRWVASATLLGAAVYRLTPLNDVGLGKCRSRSVSCSALARRLRRRAADGRQERCLVRRLLLGADGVAARAGGHEHRPDGVRRRAQRGREDCPAASGRATHGTAAILLALAVLLLAVPDAIPALTIPGHDPMPQMEQMNS
jgi:Predicted metal-binding integral membrane protein (DUF2182)